MADMDIMIYTKDEQLIWYLIRDVSGFFLLVADNRIDRCENGAYMSIRENMRDFNANKRLLSFCVCGYWFISDEKKAMLG